MTFKRSPSAGRSRRLVTVGYQRLRYRYAIVVDNTRQVQLPLHVARAAN